MRYEWVCHCNIEAKSLSAVSGSILGKIRIFNCSLGLDLGGMVEQEPQPLVSVPSIPGLNLVVVYMYCWQRLFCQMGTLNLANSLLLYDKSRLTSTLGFSFTLFRFTFISLTLQHTYTHLWHLLIQTHITL